MNSFAIFRLPYADNCTMIEGDAVVVPSLADLADQHGFLLAPFMVSEKEPIVLIKQQTHPSPSMGEGYISEAESAKKNTSVQDYSLSTHSGGVEGGYEESSYFSDFSIFHKALLDGQYRKLVLARCATVNNDGKTMSMELFQKACQLYPRMFVALVSTPQSGMWLTASPEILLESLSENRWRTIALAGTMRLRSDKADDEGQRLRWSAKNIQEQRYVAS